VNPVEMRNFSFTQINVQHWRFPMRQPQLHTSAMEMRRLERLRR